MPLTISISHQIFGIEKSGIVYGWVFASRQSGAAVAAYGGGLIFNAFHSYTWVFFLADVFCAVASLFVLLIKKEKPVIVL